MPKPGRKTLWQKTKGWFRLARIFGLAFILLILLVFLYLNKVGLPDIVKSPLLAQLRARGLDLHFSRMRWHWYHGLVAENVNVGRTEAPLGPQIFIDEIELHLNPTALCRLRVQLDAVVLHRGRLCIPLGEPTDPTARQFSVDDIMTKLRFLPHDQWELDDFQARCLGARLHLTGALTNATALSRWTSGKTTPQPSSTGLQVLRQVVKSVEDWHFAELPQIDIIFQGDAKEPGRFQFVLRAHAPRGNSSELGLENLFFIARLSSGDQSNHQLLLDVKGKADQVISSRSKFKNCYLTFRTMLGATNFLPDQLEGELQIKQGLTPWGEVRNGSISTRSEKLDGYAVQRTDLSLDVNNLKHPVVQAIRGQLQAQLLHPLKETIGMITHSDTPADTALSSFPLLQQLAIKQGHGKFQLSQAETRWGHAQELKLTARLMPAVPFAEHRVDAGWAFWTRFAPYNLDWEIQAETVQSPQLNLDRLLTAGNWRPPELAIHMLEASLYGGQFNLDAHLNVANRQASGHSTFDFNVHQIGALLGSGGQKWLRQYGWEKPPHVELTAQVILPAWTNAPPDWPDTTLATLALQGYVTCASNTFRLAPASSAQFHFSMSNGVWNIPDLAVTRPEGRLDLTYWGDDATQDFLWTARSRIDLKALKPLLTIAQQKGLDLFTFTEPPQITGRLWGRWQALERLGFDAQIETSNFTFRGESFTGLIASLEFTNRFFKSPHVKVLRGPETIEASGVGFDLPTQTVFLTNVQAHIDPLVVTRIIGPQTTEAMEPYHFLAPPNVLVNGYIVVPGPKDNNMQFAVRGGPFRYSRFNLPEVNALILWAKDTLTITNLTGDFYKGEIKGALQADFSPKVGTDLAFHVNVTNAAMHLFMKDVFRSTNQFEGALSGNLNMTYLNSSDWKSWQGYGRAKLAKGLIWDIPIFGIFSPLLNAIYPGLGNSRFDEGNATFTITNSVIFTKDLEIRAPTMRLFYTGAVDFDGKVNARMEAALNAGLIGRFLNLALFPLTKFFEYRVTGTLDQPQTAPLYIPKFLLSLFHPFKTIKDLVVPSTNKPPPSTPKENKENP